MLDISLTASLLKAVGPETALLFIGDADQLPRWARAMCSAT